MIRRSDNYDLSAQNTFRMKVSCACYIEYDTIEDLKSIDFDSLPQPILNMGEGSNLLFTKDFPGTILRSCINYVKYFDAGADEVPLAVGSGVKWDDLVAKTCADGLWGMENLSLIPRDQMPKLNTLRESDKAVLLEGLDGILSPKLQEAVWNMIWKRWCCYEDFCHSR